MSYDDVYIKNFINASSSYKYYYWDIYSIILSSLILISYHTTSSIEYYQFYKSLPYETLNNNKTNSLNK